MGSAMTYRVYVITPSCKKQMNKVTELPVILKKNKEMVKTLLWKTGCFSVCAPMRAKRTNKLEHKAERMGCSCIIQQGKGSQSCWKAGKLQVSKLLQRDKEPLIHDLLPRKIYSANFNIIQIILFKININTPAGG